MKPRTFKEWWTSPDSQSMSVLGGQKAAWNAALKEASLLCRNRAAHAYDNDENMIGEHLTDAADEIDKLA